MSRCFLRQGVVDFDGGKAAPGRTPISIIGRSIVTAFGLVPPNVGLIVTSNEVMVGWSLRIRSTCDLILASLFMRSLFCFLNATAFCFSDTAVHPSL